MERPGILRGGIIIITTEHFIYAYGSNSGDFTIPCPGDPFLDPVGEKYVEVVSSHEEGSMDNNKVDGSEERNEKSKAIDLGGPYETSRKSNETEPSTDITTNNVDTGFSNVQRDITEVQTNPKNEKVQPPQLVGLDSTDESLTWRLEGLDPKIRIDKYQVNIDKYQVYKDKYQVYKDTYPVYKDKYQV